MTPPKKAVTKTSVTMEDVAKAAGVSRQLVSLVMRDTGYVAERKKKQVLEAAEKLGYRRNMLAARLAGRQSHSIGMVVLDMHNQVFADFAEGANSILEPAGYQLLLALEGSASKSPDSSLEALVGLQVDGVLVASHLRITEKLVRLLDNTPTVTMGEPAPGGDFDAVHADDELGMKIGTEHLIALGHKKIWYLSGQNSTQNTLRKRGYKKAMQSAGLESVIIEGDATEEGGTAAFAELYANNNLPTALICYNDASAIGVLAAAKEVKVKVPEQLSVVGFDNTRAAGYPGVDLTSVEQYAKAVGARAAKLILERIAHPSQQTSTELITPRLIIRNSTAVPNKNKK